MPVAGRCCHDPAEPAQFRPQSVSLSGGFMPSACSGVKGGRMGRCILSCSRMFVSGIALRRRGLPRSARISLPGTVLCYLSTLRKRLNRRACA